MSRSFARLPQPLPVFHQQNRNRYERNRQKSEQRATPIDAEAIIHRPRKKREPGPEAGSEKIVAGVDGSSVPRIGVAQVIKYAVKQQESTNTKPNGSYNGYNPVDGLAGAPAEPEQTDRQAYTPKDGGREAVLGLDLAVDEFGFGVIVQVPPEWRDNQESADEETGKGKTLLSEVEVIDPLENEGEGLEPEI